MHKNDVMITNMITFILPRSTNKIFFTFLGAVKVPSTSNKAMIPGLLTAITLDIFPFANTKNISDYNLIKYLQIAFSRNINQIGKIPKASVT